MRSYNWSLESRLFAWLGPNACIPALGEAKAGGSRVLVSLDDVETLFQNSKVNFKNEDVANPQYYRERSGLFSPGFKGALGFQSTISALRGQVWVPEEVTQLQFSYLGTGLLGVL